MRLPFQKLSEGKVENMANVPVAAGLDQSLGPLEVVRVDGHVDLPLGHVQPTGQEAFNTIFAHFIPPSEMMEG